MEYELRQGCPAQEFNMVPEAERHLSRRDVDAIACSTVFNPRPDGNCISGLAAGVESSPHALADVKEAIPDIPVFANTGVRISIVEEQLQIADGARKFMASLRAFRS